MLLAGRETNNTLQVRAGGRIFYYPATRTLWIPDRARLIVCSFHFEGIL